MSAPAGAAGPVTRTFFFTGGEQVYNVPPAASNVHVNLTGAPGGDGVGGASQGGLGGLGGFGAVVDASVPVADTSKLFVEVGAPGDVTDGSGGFGGAGFGLDAEGAGGPSGSGGGASDVRSCSVVASFCPAGSTLSSRMLVAAGGGGGGGGLGALAGRDGGDAGSSGQSATDGGTGGGPGRAGAPCTAPPNGGVSNGGDGVDGSGGDGGFAPAPSLNYGPGGGGGGGYCGGGGGGASDSKPGAGGGGGSSFLMTAAVDLPNSVDSTGVPKITITYQDATSPSIAIQSPASGTTLAQGAIILASYSCTDDQGGAGIASCTGTVPPGQPVDTAAAGPHHFIVTATDKVGNSAMRDVGYNVVVGAAATISNVSQSASRWREGNALPTVARAKPPVGTTFKVTLDRPATVVMSFTQKRTGRKVGRKCVRPTKRNRSRRHCRRTVVAGKLTFPGRAGVNTVRFQGKLGRKKKLKPGRYTLRITATTPLGLKSSARALKFTIVR